MSNKLYLFCALIFIACNNDYTPKPWGYTRVDLPEQTQHYLKVVVHIVFSNPITVTSILNTKMNVGLI